MGDRVLTSNERVVAIRDQRTTWVLGVHNVTITDAGQYMCQVSTTPPLKLSGFLKIVGMFNWI